jgi:hypothetical protein
LTGYLVCLGLRDLEPASAGRRLRAISEGEARTSDIGAGFACGRFAATAGMSTRRPTGIYSRAIRPRSPLYRKGTLAAPGRLSDEMSMLAI